jgi:Ser/Thr protein kinase RdoA (MazF antagonist)
MSSSPTSSVWGDSDTQFFFDLHPEKILSTVESIGVRSTGRVIPLNSMENRVFEIELEQTDDFASPRVVAKFYRPGRWTKEQILEEHQFLLDLKEQDIHVVAPLIFPDGETVKKVADANIFCAVFPKQRGRNPDELNEDQLLRLGRLLARVHTIGASKSAPNRLRIDPEVYGLRNLDYLIESEAIPDATEHRYEAVVEEICERSAPLFERAQYQRIHGDCHFGNILWGDDGPFLVDFDDMVQGPPVQDIWLLVPGRDADSMEQLDLLISGYEEMREFDRDTLKLIEPLRALRFVHFSAWIQKRWNDPIFQKNYPIFGTEKYWREQLIDLEEQLEIISGRRAP